MWACPKEGRYFMKITAKGRYALAAVVYIAECKNNSVPVTATIISEELEISKPYLEQILTILKNSGVLKSVKGSSGGFLLSKTPTEISLYDILSETEIALFEKSEQLPGYIKNATDKYLSDNVLSRLDNVMTDYLKSFSIKDILDSKTVTAPAV